MPDLRSQDFDREHGFPVIDGEADTVAVNDDDSGVYLFIFFSEDVGVVSWDFCFLDVFLWGVFGGFSKYLEFDITAC